MQKVNNSTSSVLMRNNIVLQATSAIRIQASEFESIRQ